MKIGLIFAHSGLAGLWTPGCHGGAILAAAEINTGGGVFGREIELVMADSGSTPQSAHAAAQRLAIQDRVDAVIGLQPSNLRPAVRNALSGLAPYVYTSHYEGGFCGAALAPIGLSDCAILPPAVEWFAAHRAVRRVFFLGNDYIWPRVTCGLTEAAALSAGCSFAGRLLLRLGERDFAPALAAIAKARADLVVMALLGEDAVAFNRAVGETGAATRFQRLALAFDEVQLLGVGPENCENLFAAQAYFNSGSDADRHEMMESYESSFAGLRPGVTANAVNCYEAIHLVTALARRVGRPDGHLMARALGRHTTRADALSLIGQARPQRPRLAEADGTEFRVLDTFHH